jgi:basic amino acid/polyamine antiporter, APA family
MRSALNSASSKPLRTLSTVDGAVFLIGVVLGIGIFKTPSLIASNVPNEAAFYSVWLLGGMIMLMGALCYAELGSAHPDAGGEYHFLSRAYGKQVGLLFAWARGTVIQTGAIAAVAFVYGEYASVILPLGPFSAAIHAAIAVTALTALNLAGTPQTVWAQWGLTSLTIALKLVLILAGLIGSAATTVPPAQTDLNGSMGLAMVFVLLTYGGWNEAAYLSGELKDVRRNMVRTLLLGTGVVVVLYLLINYAYLHALGLQGLRDSKAIATDLMRNMTGDAGAMVLSVMISVCALSTLSATMFTGARTYYAVGRDFPAIRMIGIWDLHGDKPSNALLLQGAIALALIAFGAVTREGFEAMVAYTAPVFWAFLLLVALSIFVFRSGTHKALGYRMPLYPLPPIILAVASAWMIYSSLAYAGIGSIIGVAMLLAGTPLLFIARRS